MYLRRSKEQVIEALLSCSRSKEQCWLWVERNYPNGYGYLYHAGQKYAHRIAYMLLVGPLKPGYDVCHSCDTRNCVNPEHLSLGTRSQNLRQCVERQRFHTPTRAATLARNERQGLSKLTKRAVYKARKAYATGLYTVQQLADAVGVSRSTMRSAIKGETWANL